MSNQWDEVLNLYVDEPWQEIQKDSLLAPLKDVADLEAIKLSRWCYVITLGKHGSFVLIDKLSEQFSADHFNQSYADTPEGKALGSHTKRRRNKERGTWEYYTVPILPSEYITDYLKESRVVAKLGSNPNEGLFYRDENNLKILNIFRQNPKPPEDIGEYKKPTMFLDHVRWLLNNKEDDVQHLLKWMCNVIYRPQHRMRHGILIAGKQGTGKTIVANVLKTILKSAAKSVSTSALKGNFNAWLLDQRLVVIDEIKESDNYSLYNSIKTYFTDDTLQIEPKYVDGYTIDNFTNYFFLSNYAFPLNIDADDRRLWYVYSRVKKQEQSYYDKLVDYLFKKNGAWHVAQYLEKEILPTLPVNEDGEITFATDPPPNTDDKKDLIEKTRNPLGKYLDAQFYLGAEEFFEPEVFFEDESFKEHLKACEKIPQKFLNAQTEVDNVLVEFDYQTKKTEINGKPIIIGYFDRDVGNHIDWEAKLLAMLDANDNEGLAPHYRGHRESYFGLKTTTKPTKSAQPNPWDDHDNAWK
jgi:DNA polymerase III delta prime subunit